MFYNLINTSNSISLKYLNWFKTILVIITYFTRTSCYHYFYEKQSVNFKFIRLIFCQPQTHSRMVLLSQKYFNVNWKNWSISYDSLKQQQKSNRNLSQEWLKTLSETEAIFAITMRPLKVTHWCEKITTFSCWIWYSNYKRLVRRFCF